MRTEVSKANKLKFGNKVELKREDEGLKWYVEHLVWSNGVRIENDQAYEKNQTEIKAESFPYVYGLLYHWIENVPVYGKVVGYGSNDIDKKGKGIKKKCVRVDFTLKPLNTVHSAYFSERDLKKRR